MTFNFQIQLNWGCCALSLSLLWGLTLAKVSASIFTSRRIFIACSNVVRQFLNCILKSAVKLMILSSLKHKTNSVKTLKEKPLPHACALKCWIAHWVALEFVSRSLKSSVASILPCVEKVGLPFLPLLRLILRSDRTHETASGFRYHANVYYTSVSLPVNAVHCYHTLQNWPVDRQEKSQVFSAGLCNVVYILPLSLQHTHAHTGQ